MRALAHLLVCLRFFSRLPVPAPRWEAALGPAGFSRAAAMAPAAGAIIGMIPAAVLLAASAASLPPLLAAPLAIAALVVVTGALHEDALADCADGFGGGHTRARKLEIMRDSRIGTFGACAIALSLYLRAAALGAIAARGPWLAAALLVATAAVSRTACLLPLLLLPPARPEGLGAVAGRPTDRRFVAALAIAVGLSLAATAFGPSLPRLGLAVALAFAGALAVCALAWRQIGGQTGDVAGTAQQIAEIALLVVFGGSG